MSSSTGVRKRFNTIKRWKKTSGRSSIVDDGGPVGEHFTLRRAPASSL